MKPTIHPRFCLGAGMLWCVLLLLLISVLSGCATTFEQRLAVGYGTATGVRYAAAELLINGRITVADATNLQAQADNARAGLDITRAMARTDAAAADERLTAINKALQAVQAYLKARYAAVPVPAKGVTP